MTKTAAGSTRRLLQLCVGYFGFYVMTGMLAKYFTGMPDSPLYRQDITYLSNNTIGGSIFALGVVFLLRWIRLHSNRPFAAGGGFRIPSEVAYIMPSGICTAIVIPTTTLMYTLPISVMVAMVIMRGSIIVISRAGGRRADPPGDPQEARLRRGELGGGVRAPGGGDERPVDAVVRELRRWTSSGGMGLPRARRAEAARSCPARAASSSSTRPRR